jgi:hypothetical protein
MEPVTHSIGLSKEELEKLQEIQLLDRFQPNGTEQPHWDVEQVFSHKASHAVKHIPGQLRQRVYLQPRCNATSYLCQAISASVSPQLAMDPSL